MKKSKFIIPISLLTFLLLGCNNEAEKVIDSTVDKATSVMDKVQKVDSKVKNTASSVSPKIQIVKNTPYEYKGHKFNLNTVFKTILEDSKWEITKVDDFTYVVVTGGFKDLKAESGDSEGEKLLIEASRLGVMFPFYKKDVIFREDEVAVFYELGDERVPVETGEQALIQAFESYISRNQK